MEKLLKKLSFFVLLLIGCAGNVNAQDTDETPIRINTVLVNIPVVASDRDGRNIRGLKKEDFFIFQDGEEQYIEFFTDTEAPMNVAILIDTSGSTGSILSDIKGAARNFLAVFGVEDKGMIACFDDNLRLLTVLTPDQKKLADAVNKVAATPKGSNMYDALYKIVTKDLASVKGRKAVIVLTDGLVYGKEISDKKLLDALIESDTVIYPIFFPSGSASVYSTADMIIDPKIKSMPVKFLLNQPHVNFLHKIALSTGGRLHAASGNDLNNAFQKIADELKKQYLIGFYPKPKELGKPNNIEIKSSRDLVIRTKSIIRLRTSVKKPGDN